jgi:hypothetical protein
MANEKRGVGRPTVADRPIQAPVTVNASVLESVDQLVVDMAARACTCSVARCCAVR